MLLENVPGLRRSERRQTKKAVVLLVETGGETLWQEATSVDISQYGTRIESKGSLQPGQILELVQPESPRTPLRCMVVWSADVGSDGKAEAGLEFLQPSSQAFDS